MPMPQKVFTDYGKDFAFMMSEAPGRISREQGVMAPLAAAAKAGTILGQITASGQMTPLNPAATDGSQTAVAILAIGLPASTSVQRCALGARQFEAAARMLFWPSGISPAAKKAAEAQLATKAILVRY
jgi:hypothetical protein